jgi:hypothetical protein
LPRCIGGADVSTKERGMAIAMLRLVGRPILAVLSCRVSDALANEWSKGFTATVKITNQGHALDVWKVNHEITSAWRAG